MLYLQSWNIVGSDHNTSSLLQHWSHMIIFRICIFMSLYMYVCCLCFRLITHRSSLCAGSSGLLFRAKHYVRHHMSMWDLKALIDTALTTFTGRLFQTLTTRIYSIFEWWQISFPQVTVIKLQHLMTPLEVIILCCCFQSYISHIIFITWISSTKVY